MCFHLRAPTISCGTAVAAIMPQLKNLGTMNRLPRQLNILIKKRDAGTGPTGLIRATTIRELATIPAAIVVPLLTYLRLPAHPRRWYFGYHSNRLGHMKLRSRKTTDLLLSAIFPIVVAVLKKGTEHGFVGGGIDAITPELFAEMAVPVVLDLVICATREPACNERPSVAEKGVQLEDEFLLILAYSASLYTRPQVVHPSQPAALSTPQEAWEMETRLEKGNKEDGSAK